MILFKGCVGYCGDVDDRERGGGGESFDVAQTHLSVVEYNIVTLARKIQLIIIIWKT